MLTFDPAIHYEKIPKTVFDLDDTLAFTEHRSGILKQKFDSDEEKWHTFFEACDKDEPNVPVIRVFDAMAQLAFNQKISLEIWTGRSEAVREKTESWLSAHTKHYSACNALRMRSLTDRSTDKILKGKWIEEYGKPELVFEDRTAMVEWWRAQGITCCQVAMSDY